MIDNAAFFGLVFHGWCDMDEDGSTKDICGGADCDDAAPPSNCRCATAPAVAHSAIPALSTLALVAWSRRRSR